MKSNKTINVTIRSKSELVFQGRVRYISSINDKGPFDILPQHSNFITLIREHLKIGQTDGKEQKIDISDGVLRVSQDTADAYINMVSSPAKKRRG